MFVGILEPKEVSYTHKGTRVAFPPELTEDGKPVWRWNYAYDSEIDINCALDGDCFVGAVTVDITENSVKAVEVLVDGARAGMHTAQTDKCTGGKINVSVGMKGSTVTVRLYTTLKTVTLGGVEILGAKDDAEPLVYPTPKAIEYLGGFAKIRDVISKNGDEDEIFAAEFLKERLAETHGEWRSEKGAVIVFDKKTTRAYKEERYTVNTVRGKITVCAASRITLLYGADTVLQLTERGRGVRKFNCDDKPSKQFRGFHSGLPSVDRFEFVRRLFRYVLLPLRYNTLFVQVSACMRLKRRPEITEAWERTVKGYREGKLPWPPHYDMLANGDIIEQEDAARYVGYARELGFKIIPEVQSLGHVQYITLAHPEIAEIEEKSVTVDDTRSEDERPDEKYHHCYCPSMEESYEIVFDVIDEVIDVIKPDGFVHIGHDEIYQIGICKRCREKDPSQLLADHVNRLHDHLAERGLGTMMWADMLQPPPTRNYATYKALGKIAKDIVLLDFVWYFDLPHDIEDNLLKKGYKVAVGNLYSSHYPRYSSRIAKKNMIGGEISTWIEMSERIFGNNGKMWDMARLSEMLWNTEGYDERNRKTYTEIIAKHIQPKLRDNVRGKWNPAGYKAKSIKLPKGTPAPCEVKSLCAASIVLGSEKIFVGACYDRLVIEHATLNSAPRIVWKPIEKIGDYTVTYKDGTRVEIPVRYAENIMVYNSAYGEPMPQEYYRHNGYVGTWFCDPVYQGKGANGEDITVGGFVWENPNPEKEIDFIEYTPAENDFCGLILAGVKGLMRK